MIQKPDGYEAGFGRCPGMRSSNGAREELPHDGRAGTGTSQRATTDGGSARAGTSDLLDRLRCRDEKTWSSVVHEHEPRLRALGRSYRLGRQEVEDALQRTWLALLGHAGQIRDVECMPAWLASTMRRECLQELGRASRTRAQLVSDWTPYEVAPAGDDEFDALSGLLDRRELAARIWHLVDGLPPRQRDLLRALYGGGTSSYADASARTGVPVGAIGPTRQRALCRLRELVDRPSTQLPPSAEPAQLQCA